MHLYWKFVSVYDLHIYILGCEVVKQKSVYTDVIIMKSYLVHDNIFSCSNQEYIIQYYTE